MTVTPTEAPPPTADASVADADAAIKRAEQEATDAERLAETLAEQVRNGEDVEPDQLASAEQLGRFARLRVTAAKRKAARVREAERQRQLTALRAEIEQSARSTGPELANLLRTAETALGEFLTAFTARNEQVNTWRRQLQSLDVPPFTGACEQAHQRLSWTPLPQHAVLVGGGGEKPTQYVELFAPRYVAQMLAKVGTEHRVDPTRFGEHHSNRDPYTELTGGA